MKKRLIVFAFILSAIVSTAQEKQYSQEEKEVYKVVLNVFDAMRAGDSTKLGESFTPDAQMFTATYDKEGKPILNQGSLHQFKLAVGSPHDKVYDEPIWNTEIKIDGLLAQVWTDYAFYLGDVFSHCGVDAFQLFKTAEGWRIFHLTDTRRRENCEIPEHIKTGKK